MKKKCLSSAILNKNVIFTETHIVLSLGIHWIKSSAFRTLHGNP